MALHYGHNYKMSQVFGECERISRVQEDEQKPLLGNCLFLYQPVPPCSRPQLLLVLLDILGEGKCNSSACDYQRVCVFKGYPNLHWLLRSRGIFFKFSFIRNIDLTAPSFLKMRWPVIIQMLCSNTKILLHAKLMLFQKTGT